MTTATATAFKLPDFGTVYRCEELGAMTLDQMLDGVDLDLISSDQTMLEDLLWVFGTWEDLKEMDATTRLNCCHDAFDPHSPALAWRVRTARRQISLTEVLLAACSALTWVLLSPRKAFFKNDYR